MKEVEKIRTIPDQFFGALLGAWIGLSLVYPPSNNDTESTSLIGLGILILSFIIISIVLGIIFQKITPLARTFAIGFLLLYAVFAGLILTSSEECCNLLDNSQQPLLIGILLGWVITGLITPYIAKEVARSSQKRTQRRRQRTAPTVKERQNGRNHD